MHQRNIENLDDVKLLVDTFYERVCEDEALGNIFNGRIGDRWPEHLGKMYRFWQTVLLEDHTYLGAPFPPHTNLPVEHFHFERWLNLFHAAIDDLFEGEKAEEAKWRANRMAEMFELKIQYQRLNQF